MKFTLMDKPWNEEPHQFLPFGPYTAQSNHQSNPDDFLGLILTFLW